MVFKNFWIFWYGERYKFLFGKGQHFLMNLFFDHYVKFVKKRQIRNGIFYFKSSYDIIIAKMSYIRST